MIIRAETPDDAAAITRVNGLAFGQPQEGKLVLALRHAPGFDPRLSFVAQEGREIIGRILLTPIEIKGGRKTTLSLALAPMSVLPAWQRRGIGSALVREAIAVARRLGYHSIIVLGHADYYPRFGFDRASRWRINCPFEVSDEAFMALELKPGALSDAAGSVQYPEPLAVV